MKVLLQKLLKSENSGTKTPKSLFLLLQNKKLLFAVAVFFLILLTIFYHTIYARKIIPGVYIGNVYVGGLDYQQARQKLEKYIIDQNKVLTFSYTDHKFVVPAEDFGLTYTYDGVITRAFEIGRTGDFLTDNKDKIAGLFKPLRLRAFYDYTESDLENKLLAIKGEVNIREIDSWYELNGKDLRVTKSAKGQLIDSETLNQSITHALDNINFDPIVLPVEERNPKITEIHAERFKESAQKIIYSPITLIDKNKKWELTPKQMLSLLQIKLDDKTKEPELDINKTEFELFVDTISQEISIMPKGKVSYEQNGKVTNFELIQDGTEIDRKLLSQEFKSAVIDQKAQVVVPTKTISKENNKNRYGIYALLGEGVSKYTGSIPNRIKNLLLAAERTDGVLVAPNSTYSFNKTVGEISGRTGYDAAYIISNGRTVLGEGGGVCQTSTTLFRAVLNAGLPVVTRFPHAYRVRYYEIDSPVGIDAAVFQPSLDFQFKNDTPSYILIQTSFDKEQNSLTFRIFGTPDGRSVEVSEPVVLSQTAPPEPQYIDEPTLDKGVVRQVDFPAWGANVQFTRTVKRDGEQLFKDTFTSRYQAWRAIYLRGTKE